MNYGLVAGIIGKIMLITGGLFLLPIAVSFIYSDGCAIAFLIPMIIMLLFGFLLTRTPKKQKSLYIGEGFLIVTLTWIIISVTSAAAFTLSGAIPSFLDAVFEAVSGFTTTGATILSEIESLPRSVLFWRSFTHWIGGMGVLVFLLAIIPLSGGSNMNLMRAESPGPSVGKLVPKMKLTARILYSIYLCMTILMVILLLLGGVPLFEALCTSFGTAGTGGFGFLNDSMASFSPYVQWVITIFMILFGVNFNAYYFILYKQFRKAFTMEEVRCYFIIILTAICIIFINTMHLFSNAFEALTHITFQVGSIITTTGFSTTDFNLWPQTSKMILVLLMFIGACAGSTGGGMKVSRFMILFKSLGKELHSYVHPRSVKKIQMDGKPVEHDVVRSVNMYCFAYVLIFCASLLIVSLEGYDFTTNFTAIAATFNNIGPGLELVGPTSNFGFLSNLSKWVITFDMLAGRLELFPLLMLFHPALWKDFIQSQKKQSKNF